MNTPTPPKPPSWMAQPTNLTERAADGVAAIHKLGEERDHYLAQAQDLQRQLNDAHNRLDLLEGQLSKSEAQLHIYRELSTRLVAKLQNVALIVTEAVREAHNEAMSAAPPRRETPASSDEKLKTLAAALGPDSRPEPTPQETGSVQ